MDGTCYPFLIVWIHFRCRYVSRGIYVYLYKSESFLRGLSPLILPILPFQINKNSQFVQVLVISIDILNNVIHLYLCYRINNLNESIVYTLIGVTFCLYYKCEGFKLNIFLRVWNLRCWCLYFTAWSIAHPANMVHNVNLLLFHINFSSCIARECVLSCIAWTRPTYIVFVNHHVCFKHCLISFALLHVLEFWSEMYK